MPEALDAVEIFDTPCWLSGANSSARLRCASVVAVMAEQRFGAAVGRMDVALGVEHHDAFGRGVEDRGEFFGVGIADIGRFEDVRL